jgi:DNA-binding protein H-NS
MTEAMMEEALWLRPLAGPYYVRMFFQTWKGRGKSPEEIATMYRDHVRSRN